MKRLLVALFAMALGLGAVIETAEARRFGGGRSFGTQRTAPAPKAAPSTAPRNATPASTPKTRSGVFGAVAGLAAGLGLAALFSHLGLGEEMATFFLMGLLAFAAVMLFRRMVGGARSATPDMAYAGQRGAMGGAQPLAAAPAGTADSDFDEAAFLRQAKLNFVRLQAAYDAGDLDDIRSFTSPEVFAEIKMQHDERGGAAQQTDVVDLGADVVEVATEGARHVVSVRFHGLIREAADAAPEPFDEVWHLTKPVDGPGGWLVSGIQQAH